MESLAFYILFFPKNFSVANLCNDVQHIFIHDMLCVSIRSGMRRRKTCRTYASKNTFIGFEMIFFVFLQRIF